MNYYSVEIEEGDAWVLGAMVAKDGRRIRGDVLTYGTAYVGPQPKSVEVIQEGRRVEFNIDTWGVPIVSKRVAILIDAIASADVERFSVLAGHQPLEVLNIIHVEDCLDVRCVDLWWTDRDTQPERAGEPRMISHIMIDPSRAQNRHILRVRGWEVAVLVSDAVRKALDAIEGLGVRFVPATAT